jgi:hypothetical protein
MEVDAALDGKPNQSADCRLGIRCYLIVGPESEEGKLLWLFPPKIGKK